MNPPVYTATGNFSDPNILSLDICIPAEDSNNPYRFDNYDLSKLDANNQQINVVFSHVMKVNDNGSEWRATGYDFHLDIIVPVINEFPKHNAVKFDFNNQETIYILYHNDSKVITSELQLVYDNIEKIYDKVKTGNCEMDLSDIQNLKGLAIPRRLGLSLIPKI